MEGSRGVDRKSICEDNFGGRLESLARTKREIEDLSTMQQQQENYFQNK